MEIRRLDHASATDADIAGMFAVRAAAAARDQPADPPPVFEDVAARVRSHRPDRRRPHLVARVDGGIAGWGVLWVSVVDNLHMGMMELWVHPDHRRRGVATALLREAAAVLAEDGRTVLLIGADAGPADGLATRLGGRVVQVERLSLLRLADVDWADVAAVAAAKHPGYRIEAWAERTPDELLAGYAAAKSAMNDAPHDDADFGAFTYTPQTIRDDEAVMRPLGEYRVVAAVHEETGAVAGFTELLVPPRSPRATQEDTAVLPAHRGAGLGLWVKADMLVRVRAERPQVAEVLTGNATTNRHMLAVNDRLGFRPWGDHNFWQFDVGELSARLG
ncbi:MAG TPA: GNAT family N-acetyltransferase [Mycobacteriales bacterium]